MLLKSILRLYVFLAFATLSVLANDRTSGWCENGNQTVSVPLSSPSTTLVQRSYPRCTLTVYLAGTLTPATIYSDNNNTALGNPFTSNANGYWFFYALDGNYDVTLSGSGISPPYTDGDFNSIGYGYSTLPNAVPRNFASKMYDTVSLLDFVASGTTDYTTSLNNAVTAVGGTVGGTINIPCGIYPFSGQVTIPMNVTLIGQGSFNCSTLQYTGSSAALVFASPVTSTYLRRGGLRDLQVLGPATSCGTAAPASGTIGVYLGGDPASVISPSTYQANHQLFSNATIQCFDTAYQMGNNAYNDAFFENFIQNNNRGLYMPNGVTNSGANMDFHDGIFLNNFTAGVETDQGGNIFNFYGTQFEFNKTGYTGSTVTAYFFGVHFENNADSGCTTCGPFISVNNTAAFVKVGLTNCSGTYDNMSGTLGSMFFFNTNRLTLNSIGLIAYSSTALTQIFNITVSQVFLSQIHVDQITGDEANNIVGAFNSSAPLQAIAYEVHPNASIETGQRCYQCIVPDSSGAPMTIGNPSTLSTPPPNLVALASTNGTPRRAGAVFGDWYWEQDQALSGTHDFALFNNATSKVYVWISPTTGNLCFGFSGGTGCTNSTFAQKLTANSSGITQLAIIDGASQAGLGEIIFEATDGGSQIGYFVGTGSPNGAVTANPGSLYLNRSGGTSTTLYVKESGSATNTGWVAK